MSRISGYRGSVWLSPHAGDPPAQVTYQSAWAVTFTRAVINVTSIADTTTRYAADIVSVSGSFSGWLDDATLQAYAAAADGQPRSLIVYPDAGNTSRFFSGNVLPDYGTAGGIAAAVSVTTTWAAAGQVTLTAGGVVIGTYGSTYAGTY